MAPAGLVATSVSSLTSGCDKTALGPETSAAPVKTTDSVLTIPLSLMASSCQCALGIVEATQGHYTQNLWAAGINERNGDVSTTVSHKRCFQPLGTETRVAGEATYGTISNTEPHLFAEHCPQFVLPEVVPYRFPAASKVKPVTGLAPGWPAKRCSTVSFHPPLEFGASLNTTPQPAPLQSLRLPPWNVVP